MATTYFDGGSEIQADGLQTLYLMNPNTTNTEYSDTHQQLANMLFLNSSGGNALHSASMSHAPPNLNQNFLGIPIPNVGSADQTFGILPRLHYNLSGQADQTTAVNHQHRVPPTAANSSSGGNFDGFLHRSILSPSKQQGLSLTLSSQHPGFRSLSAENTVSGKAAAASVSGGSPSASNGISGVILGSKYLKAAQLLLDEVVKVGKSIKSDYGDQGSSKEKSKMSQVVASGGGTADDDGSSGGGEASSKAEVTTAQKQELQLKKAKLVSMLDEVEQRYRQYHQQMQIVVSSFEQAAGLDSAKSYTALALQTISKQFRCLKDAITTQIKSTSKSLGEDHDYSLGGGKGSSEGSRLKFVDHQIRQQRALQQLGMIQHNAWRPQRGLPERAVSVLRAWLFEHFLHPYPKDSDKHILAKQTGLTRSQVSNWFINARVRLWKPMVEEMYLEEVKDQEQNGSDHTKESGSKSSNDPQENITDFKKDQSLYNTLQSKQERQITQEMEGIVQPNPKKPKSYQKQSSSPNSIPRIDVDMKMKPGSETAKGINHTFGNYSLITDTTSHGNGFSAYPVGEIGRFDPEDLVARYQGNSVSLTLGLPHCENPSQQSYLPNHNISHQVGNRVDIGGVEAHYIGINVPQPSHSSAAAYENRKFFAAQRIPDFVA
jgi:hypothetical protein